MVVVETPFVIDQRRIEVVVPEIFDVGVKNGPFIQVSRHLVTYRHEGRRNEL